jgi:UDP-N-acetylmuramyl pentapeptide phosphotransferase/UDP-N-acetylglucosamine-1-phosphate transferase
MAVLLALAVLVVVAMGVKVVGQPQFLERQTQVAVAVVGGTILLAQAVLASSLLRFQTQEQQHFLVVLHFLAVLLVVGLRYIA